MLGLTFLLDYSYLKGEYCDLVGVGLQQVKGSQIN